MWRHRAPLAVLIGLLSVLLGAAAPASASASTGLAARASVLGGIGGLFGGAAVDVLKDILNALFGGIGKVGAGIARLLLTYLTSIPNFTSGNVAELAHTTTAVAFGLLAVVLTLAISRYWLSGLSTSGGGGSEAVEGLTRSIGAVLFILAWPVLFKNSVAIANSASAAVLHSHGFNDDIARLFTSVLVVKFALGGGGIGWIVQILISLAAVVGILGLVFMKVVLGASTAVLFAAMPIATILWAIPETAWVARYCARAFLVCLAIPFVWVLIFATFAAIGVDTLSFKGGGGLLDAAVIKPLTTCALLYLSISIPRSLAKMALVGASLSQSGGFLGRTASYMVARTAAGAVQAHVPTSLGGPGQQTLSLTRSATSGAITGASIQQSAPIGSPAGREMAKAAAGAPPPTGGGMLPGLAVNGAAADASAAAGNGAPTNGSGPSTTAAASAGETQRWSAPQPPAATPATNGQAARPPFNQVRFDEEMAAARQRAVAQPPTREQVAAAVDRLSPSQRQQVQAARNEGTRAQAQMAYLATADALDATQREAFRALAAADKDTFSAGVDQALRVQEPPAAAPSDASTTVTRPAEQAGTAPAVAFESAPPSAATGSTTSPDSSASPPAAPSAQPTTPSAPAPPAQAPTPAAAPPRRGGEDPPPRSAGTWFEK